MIARLSGIGAVALTAVGVVRDQVSYNTLSGVTIELLSATGPTGTYYTADDNGAFVVPTSGVYGLKFTHTEYAPIEVAAGSVSDSMTIYMQPLTKTLPGVTVTAKKNNLGLWLIAISIAVYVAYSKKG